jgi:type II secretory pathway component GspD/PulD (secretin)
MCSAFLCLPDVNGRPAAEDDRTMLNLLFLKYATVDELAKLLDQFLGEGGKMWSYAPANLLMIQDSRRNMKRLLELVSLFDDAAFHEPASASIRNQERHAFRRGKRTGVDP